MLSPTRLLGETGAFAAAGPSGCSRTKAARLPLSTHHHRKMVRESRKGWVVMVGLNPPWVEAAALAARRAKTARESAGEASHAQASCVDIRLLHDFVCGRVPVNGNALTAKDYQCIQMYSSEVAQIMSLPRAGPASLPGSKHCSFSCCTFG